MFRSHSKVGFLAIILFLLSSIPQVVIAADVDVCIAQGGACASSPYAVQANQPFDILFHINANFPGGANAIISIAASPSLSYVLSQTMGPVYTGGSYTLTVTTGISTPGSYSVVVTIQGTGLAGSANFSVTGSPAAGFDFSISMSPSTVTVKPGETATYEIAITYSDPSFSGTTINVQLSGLGPGMDYQVTTYPPTLSISTSQSTPTGTYIVVLTGSANGVTHDTSATLIVQPAQQFDFSLSTSPAQQSITPGGSTTYTVTVNLLSGTAQNVDLTVSGAPIGVSASLNPTSGTPSFSSTLSITTTSSASPGPYVLTITGTAGAVTHATTITLTVGQAPDFRIDVSPPSQTVLQGQSASYAVNVVGLNGFNSQVSLTLAGLPSGVGDTFSTPSSTPDYSSTLTLTIPSNSPTGSFALTITGSGGGMTRTANAVLAVNPAQTQAQTPSTQTTQSPSAGGFMETLQQNSLIIIGALVVLVILFGVLVMRGRRQRAIPGQSVPLHVFCGRCGAENLASNKFCVNCRSKLKLK